MNFSAGALFASFLFSLIGYFLFKEGRRRTNFATVVIGLILMFFSYFTPTTMSTWGVGLMLCGAAYYYW